MTKAWAALLWWVALCGPALADNPEPARFDHGVLWKITRPGEGAHYLFGTLHVNDPQVLALPAAVREAFEGCHTVVGEVDAQALDAQALTAAMFSGRADLPDRVGSADWPAVDALLGLRGVPAVLRPHLKPWAALVMLQKPDTQPGVKVLDVMLQTRARAAGKTVAALESADEQLAALGRLPNDTQVALLREAVATGGSQAEQTAAMIRHYLARDLAGAWQLYQQSASAEPQMATYQRQLHEALVTQRNQRFVERLTGRLAAAGGVCVAVGVLHLYGDQGVPALLNAAGWQVERVY